MATHTHTHMHSFSFFKLLFSKPLKSSNFSLHFLLLHLLLLLFSTTTITKLSSLNPSKITSFDLWKQDSNTTSLNISSRTQEFSSSSLVTTTTTTWRSHYLLHFSLQGRCKTHSQVVIFTFFFCYSRKLEAWLSPWPRTSSKNLGKTPYSS